MYEAQIVGAQKIMIQAPGNRRGARHNEYDGSGHAEGRLRLLRHSEKRTTSEKAAQNEVVHKNRAHQNYQIVTHSSLVLWIYSCFMSSRHPRFLGVLTEIFMTKETNIWYHFRKSSADHNRQRKQP
jgi:hypothetical protein